MTDTPSNVDAPSRWIVHYDATGQIHQVSRCNVLSTFNDYLVAEIPPDHEICADHLQESRFRVAGVTERDGDIPLAVLEEVAAPKQLLEFPKPRLLN